MFRFTVALTLLGLLVAGCAPAITPIPTPSKTILPSLEGNWIIKMAQSGGIMGLSRTIELKSEGSYVVVDERTSETKRGNLSKDQLATFISQFSAIEFSPIKGSEQYECADCFIYHIEISGSDSNFSIELKDISLPDSGLASLVTALRKIMDRELSSVL